MKLFLFCLAALVIFSCRGEALFEVGRSRERDKYQEAGDTRSTVRKNSRQQQVAQAKSSRSSDHGVGLTVIDEEDDDLASQQNDVTGSETGNIELSYRPTPLSRLNLKQKKEEAEEQLERLHYYASRKGALRFEEKKRLQDIYNYWEGIYDECAEAPTGRLLFSELRGLMQDAAEIVENVAFLLNIPSPFEQKESDLEEGENYRWASEVLSRSMNLSHDDRAWLGSFSSEHSDFLEQARASHPFVPLDPIIERVQEKMGNIRGWVKMFFETKVNIFKEEQQIQQKELSRRRALAEVSRLEQERREAIRDFIRKNWWKCCGLCSSFILPENIELIADTKRETLSLAQQIKKHQERIGVYKDDLSDFNNEISRGISSRGSEREEDLTTREHQQKYRDAFDREIIKVRDYVLLEADIKPDSGDLSRFSYDELTLEELLYQKKEDSIQGGTK